MQAIKNWRCRRTGNEANNTTTEIVSQCSIINTHSIDRCTMAEKPELNHMESQVSISVEINQQENDNLREQTQSNDLIQQSKGQEIEQQKETNGYHRYEDELEQSEEDVAQQLEIEELQYMLEMKDNELQEQQEKIEQLEDLSENLLRELEERDNLIQDKTDTVEEQEGQLRKLNKQLDIVEQQHTALLQQKDENIRELADDVDTKDKQIHELQQQLRQKGGEVPPHDQPDFRASPEEETKDLSMELSWRECEGAPCEMIKGSVAVDGNTAYFNPDLSGTVYKYNSDDETWTVLPECPHMSFTLAIINTLLTAVGGWQSITTLTNKLISFKEKPGSGARWKEELPPMHTKRSHIALAQQGKSLVAAGGYANGKRLTAVEIMDTETHQWLMAASLPHPFSNASLTFTRDRIYMAGGYDHRGVTNSVLTCSVQELLKSCQLHSVETQLRRGSVFRKNTHDAWQRIANLPLYLSICVTLGRKLLAIGGKDSKGQHSTAIHAYNFATNSWDVVSHMATPRSHPLVTVLPGNTLAVVGGWTVGGHTNAVQIATVV